MTLKRPVRAGRFRVALAAVSALLASAAGAAASGESGAPWQLYRDANPFVAASGLPFAPPAVAANAWRIDGVLAASNTEIAFDRPREALLYDAEIHEARIAVTRGFGEHWIARATLGADQFGSGFLDGFVEDFHRAFGFTNGDRSRIRSDGRTIAYADDRGNALQLDRRLNAIAPLLIDIAARTPADGHEFLYGATLKLPTSHASPLVDDRAIDFSLWLAAQSTDPQTRLPWGARVGILQRGDTRLLADRVVDQVPFADATFGFVLRPGWDVAAQYQWHKGLYDSDIAFLQSAGTLTLSTGWRARAGWSLRAGLVEDVPSRHAQDVTFFVGLTL